MSAPHAMTASHINLFPVAWMGWHDTSVKWTLPMLGVSACLHLCCSTCMGSFTETGAMLWVRRKQFRRLNLNYRKNEKSSLCASICLRKSNLPFFLPNGTIMRKSVWFDNGHGATNGVAAKKHSISHMWADHFTIQCSPLIRAMDKSSFWL